MQRHDRRRWWQTPTFAWIAILASALPLLGPALPPLMDLPGHVGRYHVMLDLAQSADLQRHWSFHWRAVGNLGVDLLVLPLGRVVGVELAAKLVVLAIPPLFVAGLIRLSRAATGTLSPAAAFAFPLAYGFPFQLGFVNFMLAVALALHALAWWITLGRRGRLGRRAIVFVPLSCLLWLAHSSGWGLFGVLAFAAEWVRLRGRGWRAPLLAALHCVPLALPLAAMALAPAGGDPTISYGWRAKAGAVATMLRERWQGYDVACVAVLAMLLWTAVRRRTRFGFDPLLGALAAAAFATFLALPRLMLGGAYVDTRVLPIATALALVAIRVKLPGRPLSGRIALAATGFFALRLATSTVAMALFARSQQAALAALPHLPRGAAVLVLVDEPCSSQWHSDRLGHLDGLAIARRDVFTNGQWALPGQQLIAPRHPAAEPYRTDPSQLVYPAACEFRTTALGEAIRGFDRGTFGYVWTMGFPAGAAAARDLRLVWHDDVSAVYRVDHAAAAS